MPGCSVVISCPAGETLPSAMLGVMTFALGLQRQRRPGFQLRPSATSSPFLDRSSLLPSTARPCLSGLPLTAAHEAIWAPIGYEGARWRRPEGSRPGAIGAPGTTRTCDTRFRKPLLYPLSYRGMRRIDTTQCPVTLRSVW